MADFHGETFDHDKDHERLTGIQSRVRNLMSDGAWRTPAQVAETLSLPFGTDVTRRIRGMREGKHGGFEIESERVEGGVWRYRCTKPSTGQQGKLF